MCGDLTFQALDLRARLRNFNVDLVQRMAFFRQFVLAIVNLCARRVLGFVQAINFASAHSQFAFQIVELPARMMRLEHAQVGV